MDMFQQLFDQDSQESRGTENAQMSESNRQEDRSDSKFEGDITTTAEQAQQGNIVPFEKKGAALTEQQPQGAIDSESAADEQRDLFGELIDSAPDTRSKARAAAPKPSSSSAVNTVRASNSGARGWKDQDIEVGIDFTVHYATRTFLVEDLIEEIPESGKVHLNVIREALFREYWDFSESRTKWDYDLEEKKLCPIIIGEKNNVL